MAKLLASDFDGTLCRNGTITKQEIEAIARWRSEGNLFGCVTGRGMTFSSRLDLFGVKYDFNVVYNGAVIFDGLGYRIFAKTVDVSLFPKLIELSRENGAVDWGKELDDGELHQFSAVMANDAEAIAVSAIINKRYGDRIIAYTNGKHINAVEKSVSKASGVCTVMRHFRLFKKDIYVVGDSYNDLPMILEFNGYAIASACDDIKKKSAQVCADLSELIETELRR